MAIRVERRDTMRLKDKVALVTGAGSGIGRAIALEFAREGAKLLLAELNEESGRAVADEVCGAAARRASSAATRARKTTYRRPSRPRVEAFGRLDVMVNNAGVSQKRLGHDDRGQPLGRVLRLPARRRVHGRAAAAARSSTCRRSSGSSASARRTRYVAAKHGVVGLTKNFAIRYGPRGVRVNCINPGWIDDADDVDAARQTRRIQQQVETQVPLGRFGTPEEVAKLALFLASDESSLRDRRQPRHRRRLDGALASTGAMPKRPAVASSSPRDLPYSARSRLRPNICWELAVMAQAAASRASAPAEGGRR